MGSREVISVMGLKEPVTIQYSGNRKKMDTRIRTITSKDLIAGGSAGQVGVLAYFQCAFRTHLLTPLSLSSPALNWMAEKMAMMMASTTPMALA